MIDIEELLADHLTRGAARAVPRPDLDAVMAAQTVVVLRQSAPPPASPRWRTRLAVGAVCAVGIVITSIVALRPDSQPTAVVPGSTADSTCQVFVRPEATTEEIMGVGERLRQRAEVINLRLVSQQQAYEEFLRLFAGKDDLTGSVTAEILPAKWMFDLDPNTAANRESVIAQFSGSDRIAKQALCAGSVTPATPTPPRATNGPITTSAAG